MEPLGLNEPRSQLSVSLALTLAWEVVVGFGLEYEPFLAILLLCIITLDYIALELFRVA